jgi:hypothetical protein
VAAEHRIKAAADLEQRCGRALRHGHTADTVQIFYYFADGSTRDEVRDASKPQTSRKEPRGR